MPPTEDQTPRIRVDEQRRITEIALKFEPTKTLLTSSSIRVFEAAQHYNKLCLHLQSFRDILRLYSKSKYFDVSCLAALARMIVESQAAIRYFSQRQIPKEELQFRIEASNYHHHIDTLNILGPLGFDDDDGPVWISKVFSKKGFSSLELDPFFIKLPKNEQAMILRGERPYPYKFKYTKKLPFPKTIESALYKLLSAFIHSMPISSALTRDYSSTHHLGFENMIFLTNEIVIAYAAAALDSYCSLRPRLAKSNISSSDRSFIRQNSNIEQTRTWVAHRKNHPSFW